jgi:hypothetical protein
MTTKKLDTSAMDMLIPRQVVENQTTENQTTEELTAEYIKKKRGPGRPVTQLKKIKNSSQLGTLEGETRATFIVRESQLEEMKRLAYWERIKVKDIVIQGIDKVLNEYKREKGPIKEIPSSIIKL